MSSNKTDWILSELPLLVPSCLLYRWVNGQMNDPEGECLCLLEIFINVNKLPEVLLLPIYLFILVLYWLLLLYFCLLVDHINKSIIFVFLELLFIIFKNNISIIVKISKKCSFHEFLSADFWKKVWERIKLSWKFDKYLSLGVGFKL